ncbi:MAG: type II toxin-antitoxin system Phd/YefM family antitoxin [Deltaproteobacteria bacterium]|nr:type II toxin-antitoxin system Phd/YefM family antitoxin [Deltaproteobacteria bacterium]
MRRSDDYNGHMARASVSEVKANLSRFLRMVQRGSEVQIEDRGTPIARLVGLSGAMRGAVDARISTLIEAGSIRRGSGDLSWILTEAPIDIGPPGLATALDEEREDRF